MSTQLNITGIPDDLEGFDMSGMLDDGTYDGARGGTEMMREELFKRVDNDLLDNFNIICSRVTNIESDKTNLLWLHDTWDDPMSSHLKDEKSRARFGKLIFVSNWQQWTYAQGLNVPFMDGCVVKNAINPIEYKQKDKDGPIRLIYHTTPHRGLDILVAAFQRFCELRPEVDVVLDVYSSFEIYGPRRKDQDKPFEEIFQLCRDHPKINYHGYQPNEIVREALQKAHIYTYPSCWPETSCISVLEAMSAGCAIICPNFAALPETTANWATMYPYAEDKGTHCQMHLNVMNNVISHLWQEDFQLKLTHAMNYINTFYNWDLRANEWSALLQGMLSSLENNE